MAHNLATIRHRIAMAYRGENPWHKLGAKLGEGCSLEEAIRAASLDYQVSLAPLYLQNGSLVNCRQAVMRDADTVLGTVGPGYKPVQNRAAFDIVETLIGEGGMAVETAGALGEGETAWMLLKNHSDIKIGVNGTDVIKPYLLMQTSHDGTSAITAKPTAVRVVCQNTLNMVKDKATISVRHTANVTGKLAEAKRILGTFAKAKAEAESIYQAMSETPLSLTQLIDYWATVFPGSTESAGTEESRSVVAQLLGKREENPIEERRAIVAQLLESGRGSAGHTAWGAYNAVTEFVDHVYVSRQNGEYRTHGAQSALFGGGALIRDKAWGAALALTVRS